MSDKHPGAGAMMAARETLFKYQLPGNVDLLFTGMHRVSGAGAWQIERGLLTVQATLHGLTGGSVTIDIPITVKDGKMLAPEIFRHKGRVRVFAQSSIDDITKSLKPAEHTRDRKNMFSPPSDGFK